jgi:hypothetical protein
MATLSVKDNSGFFPIRPSFGTDGTEVVLWANYFNLKVSVRSLFKYTLRVTAKKVTKAQDDEREKAQEGQKGDDLKEAKGKKLQKIIQQVLGKFPATLALATEFKANLVSSEKLSIPPDGVVQVDLAEPGRKTADKWFVRFDGPESLDIGGLLGYLRTFDDLGYETVYPRFSAEIDALGVVLGHTARADFQNTSTVGRNRFFAIDPERMEAEAPQDSILAILRGYVQSVRPATGRLLLNANVTHGVFRGPESTTLDSLFERLGLVGLDKPNPPRQLVLNLTRIHKFLMRAPILCRRPGDKPGEWVIIERSIAGLASVKDGSKENPLQFTQHQIPFGSPTTVKFRLNKPSTDIQPPKGLQYGSMIDTATYFRAKYGLDVKKGLPLINLGNAKNPRYVPAEWCKLARRQPIKTKLSPREQDSMIRFACRPPPSNALSITTSARKVLALDNNPLLDRFGISVGTELITVKGRELLPPAVAYTGGNVTPESGSWLMRNVKVVKPGAVKTWSFLHLGDQHDHAAIVSTVQNFASFLRNKMGINFPTQPVPQIGILTAAREADLKVAFEKLNRQSPRPEFVLVVLPDKDTLVYNCVKKLGDVSHGFHTVCVVKKNFVEQRGQKGYFANVGLKVNLKLGGVNHRLQHDNALIKAGKTMFVGYDVTHPTNLAPGVGEDAPSLVGLVASVDSDLAQWPAVAWKNQSRVEMLDAKLVQHFQDRLKLWQNKNQGRLPENIVIFRDGVSEGQYRLVLEKELPFIRTACKTMYPANAKQPRISLIVSVKRHQTRFYPADREHIHPRSKSPKEGTIVDRGVTSVRYWDFFLQAHASLQGKSRGIYEANI